MKTHRPVWGGAFFAAQFDSGAKTGYNKAENSAAVQQCKSGKEEQYERALG
ncbi:hypothetical protein [Pygmaiobacter massiliensis]|uniref:hypothetical protein n=1 Tax=Pygmaiobacter massiliensis TaxID=1917873 RepID=UPI0028A28D1D|nr:hypothetical protein [Pygmaiobacter massiliensis]MDY4784753.1 hypothetical protein [Pygmaiobacter massiliensis]